MKDPNTSTRKLYKMLLDMTSQEVTEHRAIINKEYQEIINSDPGFEQLTKWNILILFSINTRYNITPPQDFVSNLNLI